MPNCIWAASPELIQQSSETLAGRISYLELPPLNFTELPKGEIVAIEIKRTLSPRISRGFTEAMQYLNADRGLFLMPQGESFPLASNVTALSLAEFLQQLS
jgi:predicted AAA+ superfamily ATPase